MVKFKTKMEEAELLKVAGERKPEFQKLDKLIQKYYFKDSSTGEFGGIYIWESKEAMLEYRETELAKTIPTAYQVDGIPDIQLLDVFYPLRD
ncbi:MAG: YdhR family protein [Candidatus Heimdallarchaeota archaeon]|nr:YdhR family protein [Candidatus Heimdallarchaeota archaeon]